MSASRKHILGSIAIFGITIAVLLLAAEGAVRVLDLQSSLFTQPHPEIGWVHRPNVRGTYVSSAVKSPVVINHKGLMGPHDYPYEKPPGTKRLLLLGDSFTESEQVPYEQSWPALLDQKLGEPWEVLNAGVAGYGTDNALLFYLAEGRKYDPDAVFLLVFTGNDISDNDRELAQEIGSWQPQPYFDLEGNELVLRDYPLDLSRRESFPARIKQWLREHSQLYLFVHERIHRARAMQQQLGREPVGEPTAAEQPGSAEDETGTSTVKSPASGNAAASGAASGTDSARASSGGGTRQNDDTGRTVPRTWHVYRTPVTEEWQRAWDLTDALLGRLRRETRSDSASFSVGIMPTGWRIDPVERERLLEHYPAMADTHVWKFDLPDRMLEATLQSLETPVLNLAPALDTATRRTEESMFLDHLSPAGHEVVAEAVAWFLREHGSVE